MKDREVLSAIELSGGYGYADVVKSVSLKLVPGETLAIVGANGAGKTTFLRLLAGALRPTTGTVTLQAQDVTKWSPERRLRGGLAHVPEGRELFPSLSVLENLKTGAYIHGRWRAETAEQLDKVVALFPILSERLRQQAGSLSGGEQQMLAIARALMARPDILLLDEPSFGLAPLIRAQVFEEVARLGEQGMGIILVEQHVREALSVADKAYVMYQGDFVLSGPSGDVLADPELEAAYLGRDPVSD